MAGQSFSESIVTISRLLITTFQCAHTASNPDRARTRIDLIIFDRLTATSKLNLLTKNPPAIPQVGDPDRWATCSPSPALGGRSRQLPDLLTRSSRRRTFNSQTRTKL